MFGSVYLNDVEVTGPWPDFLDAVLEDEHGNRYHLAVEASRRPRTGRKANGPLRAWSTRSLASAINDNASQGVTPPWRRSPNVVQYRPNTRQDKWAGPTRDQRETTRTTSQSNLQNLHPRFKSGRHLRSPSTNRRLCSCEAQSADCNWTSIADSELLAQAQITDSDWFAGIAIRKVDSSLDLLPVSLRRPLRAPMSPRCPCCG